MIEILAQTDDYIAVNKPADMLVHRTWLSCGETVFLLQTLRDQYDPATLPLEEKTIDVKASDITIERLALGYVPLG